VIWDPDWDPDLGGDMGPTFRPTLCAYAWPFFNKG
jgi:hypothetical protein